MSNDTLCILDKEFYEGPKYFNEYKQIKDYIIECGFKEKLLDITKSFSFKTLLKYLDLAIQKKDFIFIARRNSQNNGLFSMIASGINGDPFGNYFVLKDEDYIICKGFNKLILNKFMFNEFNFNTCNICLKEVDTQNVCLCSYTFCDDCFKKIDDKCPQCRNNLSQKSEKKIYAHEINLK